ncbi:hypothetical protein COK00_15600 [Bacillus cereus]|uniref:Uncharacterized protein n=1 Tax=Bacillus cereus TaxID=1396 RepID=A0A2B3ZJD1_BACCE|nr:hypothetical protein CON28_18210 [Bacillus cereus]PEQ46091.1 hypothetical protein CN468_24085 [Bacillus cereus]PEX37063.1 hypothetical protein CN455_18525 [Bacillus cereus]PFB11337.1 hypothetical protein CN399_25875 [Bacillus cereus]PFB60992.1 hypothetical protein CN291_24085 [Bacillus cereus]
MLLLPLTYVYPSFSPLIKYSIYTHSFFVPHFPLIAICRITYAQPLNKWYNLFESLLLHFLIREKALTRKLASYQPQAIGTFCHLKRHSKECLFFYIQQGLTHFKV